MIRTRALIINNSSGLASVAPRCQARKPPAGPPGRLSEGPEKAKKLRYTWYLVCVNMSENQVEKKFKRLPNLEKACVSQDALGCLGEETSCFNLCVILIV